MACAFVVKRPSRQPSLMNCCMDCTSLPPAEVDRALVIDRHDPIQALNEVLVPHEPAELAVGHALQSGFFLFANDPRDLQVLDFAQRIGRYVTPRASGARLLDRRRT